MKLISNKKILAPLIFVLAGFLILPIFYFIGLRNIQNSAQKKILDDISKYSSPQNNINITQGLTSEVLSKIAETNTVLGSSNDKVAIPDNKNVEEAINQAVSKFNPEMLKPEIDDSDLKIIKTTPDSLSQYFKEFKNILEKYSNTPTLDKETTLANFIASLISYYQFMLEDFFNLEVPQEVVSFHKEEISLISAKVNILKQLKNYENDPLFTLLSIKSEEYFDNQFEELKENINNFITKNNINF